MNFFISFSGFKKYFLTILNIGYNPIQIKSGRNRTEPDPIFSKTRMRLMKIKQPKPWRVGAWVLAMDLGGWFPDLPLGSLCRAVATSGLAVHPGVSVGQNRSVNTLESFGGFH